MLWFPPQLQYSLDQVFQNTAPILNESGTPTTTYTKFRYWVQQKSTGVYYQKDTVNTTWMDTCQESLSYSCLAGRVHANANKAPQP